MAMEITQVLSIISCIVAVLALARNFKMDTNANAGQMTEVIIKLVTINENVKEVKSDIKDTKAELEKQKEELIVLRESVANAHARIDALAGA